MINYTLNVSLSPQTIIIIIIIFYNR